MPDVVQPSESLMWHIEADPHLRSTIVAVAFLDRAPDWERLVARVDHATAASPGFRQRLVDPPLRVGRPVLVDAAIDLGFHVRRTALPAGAGPEAVFEFARTEGMEAFDPARPLWRFTLVEGLPDGAAAIVMKVHHALTDGVGSMQLAPHLFDLDADAPQPAPPPAPPHVAQEPSPVSLLLGALGQGLRDTVELAGAVGRAVPSTVGDLVRHPRDTVGALAETAASVGRMVQPIVTTRSPVMTDRSLVWRYEPLEVPFPALRDAGRAVDGTVNDAFLAAVTGGFRRYHDKAGAPVERLRITLPVSVRADGDRVGGNRFTLLRFEVPVAEADPAVRMRRLHEVVARQRRERAIPHTQRIAAVLDLLPPAVTGGMLKHIDAVVSNVPGIPVPLFLVGSRVTAMYPFGPTSGAAVNVTLLSYDGTCHLGVNIDTGAVHDPDLLVTCMRDGLDEVVALGRGIDRR